MTGASPAERVSRDEIVALASRLISIPSTSGEERAVMEEVIRWCTAVDLPFEVIASDHDRPNVVITLGDPADWADHRHERAPRHRPGFGSRCLEDRSIRSDHLRRREETLWSRRVRHEELGRGDAPCHRRPEGRAAAGLRAGARRQRRRNRRHVRHDVPAGGDRRRAPATTRLLPHRREKRPQGPERRTRAARRRRDLPRARLTHRGGTGHRRQCHRQSGEGDSRARKGHRSLPPRRREAGHQHQHDPGRCRPQCRARRMHLFDRPAPHPRRDARVRCGRDRRHARWHRQQRIRRSATSSISTRCKDHIPANITEDTSPLVQALQASISSSDGSASRSISSPGPAPPMDASTARRGSTPSATAPAARTPTAPTKRSRSTTW